MSQVREISAGGEGILFAMAPRVTMIPLRGTAAYFPGQIGFADSSEETSVGSPKCVRMRLMAKGAVSRVPLAFGSGAILDGEWAMVADSENREINPFVGAIQVYRKGANGFEFFQTIHPTPSIPRSSLWDTPHPVFQYHQPAQFSAEKRSTFKLGTGMELHRTFHLLWGCRLSE